LFKLSDSFIEPYKTRKPDFGPVGEIVFKRTYSRDVEGENRTEDWWETCRRVVEGTFELQRRHIEYLNTRWNAWRAQMSSREMYQLMFDFKFLPPGRGLFAMGSDFV
jgi:hypothetical protein